MIIYKLLQNILIKSLTFDAGDFIFIVYFFLSLIGNSLNIHIIWVVMRRNAILNIPFFVCLLKINNTLFNFFDRGVFINIKVICGRSRSH